MTSAVKPKQKAEIKGLYINEHEVLAFLTTLQETEPPEPQQPPPSTINQLEQTTQSKVILIRDSVVIIKCLKQSKHIIPFCEVPLTISILEKIQTNQYIMNSYTYTNMENNNKKRRNRSNGNRSRQSNQRQELKGQHHEQEMPAWISICRKNRFPQKLKADTLPIRKNLKEHISI